MAKELKNKPLIEAILELRWALKGEKPEAKTDPHFKILLGRLYDRVSKQYPELEQLPTASIPEELFGRGVQYRFRTKENGWPLIQVGPGILSVNSTEDYIWKDFQPMVLTAFNTLFDAHPKPSDLKITSLVLRYIDAVEFDYTKDDAYKNIAEFLKVKIQLPKNLFQNGIDEKPTTFSWQTSHRCTKPAGMVTMRFASGQKREVPAIIWETIVESAKDDLPKLPEGFAAWTDAAHDVTDDWFFKLIEGELERRFSGD